MKRFASLAILSIILAACAPVSSPTAPTLSPTDTPQPTATSQPTNTPEPTATPEGFRESNGSIQVWKDGKWVELQIPDTPWKYKPEESSSIVIKDNGVVLQVKLNGFQTPDGGNVIDIAGYNKETGEWDVKPFSVTRTNPLQNVELYERNNRFDWGTTPSNVNVLSSGITLLGLRTTDKSGEMGVEFMVLYKGNVIVLSPEEIWENAYNQAAGKPISKIIDKNGLDLGLVNNLLEFARRNNSVGRDNFIPAYLKFDVPQRNATLKSCNFTWDGEFRPRFVEWCRDQIEKGPNRKIINKDNIDWIFLHQPNPIVLDKNYDYVLDEEYVLDDLAGMWDVNGVIKVVGAFLGMVFLR
ncbi:MAG: hypothetical protein IT313_01890 [Anaerolineales bacterium]|nr:hypothetical protein [Anaerolineales bacterium]